MPKYNNSFRSPTYIEETILNEQGIVGTVRVKPSGILWRPKGAQKFYAISLDKFTQWISDQKTAAKKTSS